MLKKAASTIRKLSSTKISLSDSDQTPKSTCSHEHTALISIELTAKNLRPETELKLTNDVLEARHTDMKQKPVIIVLSPFIEATDSKCNHHPKQVPCCISQLQALGVH